MAAHNNLPLSHTHTISTMSTTADAMRQLAEMQATDPKGFSATMQAFVAQQATTGDKRAATVDSRLTDAAESKADDIDDEPSSAAFEIYQQGGSKIHIMCVKESCSTIARKNITATGTATEVNASTFCARCVRAYSEYLNAMSDDESECEPDNGARTPRAASRPSTPDAPVRRRSVGGAGAGAGGRVARVLIFEMVRQTARGKLHAVRDGNLVCNKNAVIKGTVEDCDIAVTKENDFCGNCVKGVSSRSKKVTAARASVERIDATRVGSGRSVHLTRCQTVRNAKASSLSSVGSYAESMVCKRCAKSVASCA